MRFLRSKKIVAVHSGNFHPDDVFATAALSILLDGKIEILRTRDEGELAKADYVADVGHIYDPAINRFDHHQEGGAGFRNEQISYSAFGLVWKTYGEKICGSKQIAKMIDENLVAAIDADDDGLDVCQKSLPGVKPFMLVDVIYSMRPTWKEDGLNIDQVFLKAVAFAREVLLREIKIAKDEIEAEGLMAEVYKKAEDKRIIILDRQYLPSKLLQKYSEPLFTIYENRDKKMWRVGTIDKSENTYVPRKNFPESWWGKKGEDFARVSGVEDAIFCRNKGIFLGVKTKEGALKLANIALNQNNNK